MKKLSRLAISTIALSIFLCAFCVLYAYFVEPGRLVVNEHVLEIEGWNAAFDGFKIAAISDIHGGSNGIDEAYIRRLVQVANEQNADIIVLLGDYVSHKNDGQPMTQRVLKMPMSLLADSLKGLSARHGVFAVLGNHDGWYNDNITAAELRRSGFTVLRNEVAVVDRGGHRLRILGLNDHMKLNSWSSFDSDIRTVISGNGSPGDFVVLEHSPDIFQVLNHFKTLGSDFKLMIAGHTHGGQVWLPIVGSPIVPSSFGQKYNRGHVKEHGADMFVTTGIGTSILPFRFMMPPEIAVLTIRSK